MDHREASLDFLKHSGLYPVKVRPKQKDPFPDWEPRLIKQQDHRATLRRLTDEPNLNVGGVFFGKYVDLDIDTTTSDGVVNHAMNAALEHFLPPTPYVWGRKSKPRSHRCYVLHEDFDRAPFGPLLRFLKALKIDATSYSVEVRGGEPEAGMFTVLPGSYREDCDEWVEWDRELDVSVSAQHIPIETLLRSIRLSAATALIANYFGDGVRNDMSLAIAGLFWRIRNSSMVSLGIDTEEECPDGTFLLTEDDAYFVFQAVLKIADTNSGDRRQRELNFTNTWKKLDRDPAAKVTGGKIMAELIGGDTGEKVIRALYRLLSDNVGIEALEKLAEQFCVWYGAGVLIDLNLVRNGAPVPWMTKEQAHNSLGNQKIMVGNKKVGVTNVLFGSNIIPRVAGLTFDPSTTDQIVDSPQGPAVNQWKGFQTEACPQRVSDDEMEPFIYYVREILAAGDEMTAKWIMSWCADLFQEPANKPGTTLVLIGVQGAGKSFLGEGIISKIIGSTHSVQMNSIETLTDKFNSIADNKIFVQCDEAVHSHQRSIASKLKSLITDETMTIEPKGINSFRKPNHMHIVFTSNEESNPVFIDPSPHERRFTVVKVSPQHAHDEEYWTRFRSWVEMNLAKILRWLQDYRYKKEFIRRPIQTAAKRDIQRLGVDPEISWILNRIQLGFPIDEAVHEHWWHAFNGETATDEDKVMDTLLRDEWPDRIHMPVLEADFKKYVREHGRPIYSGNLATVIRKVMPPGSLEQAGQVTVDSVDGRTGRKTKNRVRMHTFPSRDQLLTHMYETLGPVVQKYLDDAASEVEEIKSPTVDRTDF